MEGLLIAFFGYSSEEPFHFAISLGLLEKILPAFRMGQRIHGKTEVMGMHPRRSEILRWIVMGGELPGAEGCERFVKTLLQGFFQLPDEFGFGHEKSAGSHPAGGTRSWENPQLTNSGINAHTMVRSFPRCWQVVMNKPPKFSTTPAKSELRVFYVRCPSLKRTSLQRYYFFRKRFICPDFSRTIDINY